MAGAIVGVGVALYSIFKNSKDAAKEQKKLTAEQERQLRIQKQIDDITVEKDKEYQKDVEKYTSMQSRARAEYNLWFTEERKRISALKIIIPHDLEETYKSVTQL